MKKIDIVLQENYISEDTIVSNALNEMIEENQVSLIVAPQGTGKTEYARNLKLRKLLLEPTIAMADQLEEEGFNRQSGSSVFTFEMSGVDEYGYLIQSDYTSTYASSRGIDRMQLVNEFDILFVDEIHKIVQYSNFAYGQVEMALEIIDKFIQEGKKVVFMTATDYLLECLSDTFAYRSIEQYVYVRKEKQYVKSCYMIKNLMNVESLKVLITKNKGCNNFQIALINNKDMIECLVDKLKMNGVSALSVNSNEYKKNIEGKKDLLNDIKVGEYHGYDVLLTTSFIDVGLNFMGDNISHIYCVFDSSYVTGDLTLIDQFVARTRNSMPTLYINKPQLNEHEIALLDTFDLFDGEKQYALLYNTLKNVAEQTIENYKCGYYVDIQTNNYFGIYKNLRSNHRKDRYCFSSITLKYQLSKLRDKITMNNDEFLKYKFNTEDVHIIDDIEIKKYETIKLIGEYLNDLLEAEEVFPMKVFRERVHKINGGILELSKDFKLNALITTYYSDKFKYKQVGTKRYDFAKNPVNVYRIYKV